MENATKRFYTIPPRLFLLLVHSFGSICDQFISHVTDQPLLFVPFYGGRKGPSREVAFQVNRFVFFNDIRSTTTHNDLKIAWIK